MLKTLLFLAPFSIGSLFSSLLFAATNTEELSTKNSDTKRARKESTQAILQRELQQGLQQKLPQDFFLDGQALTPWVSAIGDPGEWYIPTIESQQVSKQGAISLTLGSENTPEAIITWSPKNIDGTFTVTGQTLDLKLFSSQASLVIELKMHHKVRYALNLSMDCTYPCRGSLNIRPLLNQYPINEWIKLPVPLKCFEQMGTDLSKVSAPLHLQSRGNLTISLKSIRLEKNAPDNAQIKKGLCQ